MFSFLKRVLRRRSQKSGQHVLEVVPNDDGRGDAREGELGIAKPKVKRDGGKSFFKQFFHRKKETKVHIDTKYAKKNMKRIRALGSGSFGNVSLIVDKPTGLKMALKIQSQSNPDFVKLAAQEAELAKILSRHPLFADYYGHFTVLRHAEKEFHLFVEYIQQSWTLDVFFENHYRISEQYQFMAWQIVEAVKYLYTKRITHRDVKPGNILVNSGCFVKVIDLGVAARGSKVWKTIGTPGYMAPEVEEAHLTGKSYGVVSDYYYSVGATLYHAVFSEPPKPNFHLLDWKAIFSQEQEQELRTRFVFGAPKEIVNFLNELLCLDPRERLNDKNILGHPFFYNVQEMRKYFTSSGIDAKEKPKNDVPWTATFP